MSKKTFWIVLSISLLVHGWQFYKQRAWESEAWKAMQLAQQMTEETRKAYVENCELLARSADASAYVGRPDVRLYCEAKFSPAVSK